MKILIKLRQLSEDKKWCKVDITIPRSNGESLIGKTMQIGKAEEFDLEEEIKE